MIRCTEAGGLSLIEGKTKAKAGRGDLRVGFGTRFELTRNFQFNKISVFGPVSFEWSTLKTYLDGCRRTQGSDGFESPSKEPRPAKFCSLVLLCYLVGLVVSPPSSLDG